jgi:hypothetical protein
MSTGIQLSPSKSLALPALSFAGLVLLTVALFFIPAIIIQPFKHQSERGLLIAMAIRQQAPLLSILTATGTAIMAALLWRRTKIWAKGLIVVGLCAALGAAVMARIDYFEWMFHPVSAPGFESAASSKLSPAEMVMTVSFGGDSRAYPISIMAYHHVLNDVVGGVPIAVTY